MGERKGGKTWRGAVAAGHAETAEAAAEVLRAGGNAFDAAVAAMFAACVAEPVLASAAGGGFLIAKTADLPPPLFDFFTVTPKRRQAPDLLDAHEVIADFGPATQAFHIGMGTVATPGFVAGALRVHDDLGRIPLADVLAPARRLAAEGVTVSPFQAYLLTVVAPIYLATPEARSLFAEGGADGRSPLGAGSLYRPADFAGFLDALAREGADLFYKGEIAQRFALMAREGGSVEQIDLAEYRVERRAPVRLPFAGAEIFLNPPPSIGGALIGFGLSLLDGAEREGWRFGDDAHVRTLVGAMAATQEARRDCGLDDDSGKSAWRLLAPDFIASFRAAAGHAAAYRGTTHISVADASGNLAAVTLSNGEGCGHILPGTGIMPNNMLGEDDINAGGPHDWRPGTRMSSMMAPTLLRDAAGRWTALGSGGSNRIRSAILQVLFNMAALGMEPADAVGRPRLHLEGRKLSLEPGFGDTVAPAAHADEVQVWPSANMFFGGVHTVRLAADMVSADGAGDARRDGVFKTV